VAAARHSMAKQAVNTPGAPTASIGLQVEEGLEEPVVGCGGPVGLGAPAAAGGVEAAVLGSTRSGGQRRRAGVTTTGPMLSRGEEASVGMNSESEEAARATEVAEVVRAWMRG